jgi:hypothetical protein
MYALNHYIQKDAFCGREYCPMLPEQILVIKKLKVVKLINYFVIKR